MKRTIVSLTVPGAALVVTLLASTVAVAARGESKKGVNLTGHWTLTTAAEGPHGAVSMGLVLKHEGSKVTGSLTPPHGGEITVAGEFHKETLTLAEPSGDGLTLKATLQADGKLSGYLSTPRGDMTWTAERVKTLHRR